MNLRIVFTFHAQEQMVVRGVSAAAVRECILRGSKQRQTDGLLASHGYVAVAYRMRGYTAIVKTVMLR